MRTLLFCFVSAALFLSGRLVHAATTNDARGLWVGEVTLQKVNETVDGINAANQRISPNPAVPTPVNSPAHIRILFHVDASGQVRLLKGVSIVNKSTNTTPDIALITDPALYSQYGQQTGGRITAVAFEFGDATAAEALNQIATAAGTAAAGGSSALAAANQVVQSYRTNMPAGATPEYTNFIQSTTFSSTAATAATAAQQILVGSTDLPAKKLELATAAALKALTDANVVAAADALTRNEILCSGQIAPSAVLAASIYLGADHAANPYRHKWHPSHRHGYAISRAINLSFDSASSTNAMSLPGFGVDRITGNYREEISGLHKALGPNQDIGLITEGRIKLEHVSLVDTLNQ